MGKPECPPQGAPHVSPPPPNRAGGSTPTKVAHRGRGTRAYMRAMRAREGRTSARRDKHTTMPSIQEKEKCSPVTSASSTTGGKKRPPGPIHPVIFFSFLYFILFFLSFFGHPKCLTSKDLTSGQTLHASPPGAQRRRAPAPGSDHPGQQLPRSPQRSSRGNPIRPGTLTSPIQTHAQPSASIGAHSHTLTHTHTHTSPHTHYMSVHTLSHPYGACVTCAAAPRTRTQGSPSGPSPCTT